MTKLNKRRRKTPPKKIMSGFKVDYPYFVVWASGFHAPNWAAFGCKQGLIEAYRHEMATIASLQSSLYDPYDINNADGYNDLEIQSHQKILSKIKKVATKYFDLHLTPKFLKPDEEFGKIRFDQLNHSWFATILTVVPKPTQAEDRLKRKAHKREERQAA